MAADKHGDWFVGNGGLYLLSEGDGVVRVSDQSITAVAGDCI
jgi:hypothetical protein